MDVFVGGLLGPVDPDVVLVPPDALDLPVASVVVLGEWDVPGVVPFVLGAGNRQAVGLDEPVGSVEGIQGVGVVPKVKVYRGATFVGAPGVGCCRVG